MSRSLLKASLRQLSEIWSHCCISTSLLSSDVSWTYATSTDLATSDSDVFLSMQQLYARLVQRLLQILIWRTFWFESTCLSLWFIKQRSCFSDRSDFFCCFDSCDLDEIEAWSFFKSNLSCDHFRTRHSYYKWLIWMRRRVFSSRTYFKDVEQRWWWDWFQMIMTLTYNDEMWWLKIRNSRIS